MATQKTLYPVMTMEECARRITGAVTARGFSEGHEADRYAVETSDGPVLILVLDKYFMMEGGSVVLTAVLDTVQDGALRVHLTSSGAYFIEHIEQKVIQWVEGALQNS